MTATFKKEKHVTRKQTPSKDVALADASFDGTDARFDQIVDGAELELKTLRGDLRDTLLNIVRSLPAHWGNLPKMQQQDCAHLLDTACEKLVRNASDVLASHGRPKIACTIENFQVKDGLVIKAKAAFTSDNLALLGDAQNRGKNIVVTIADAGAALGQRGPAKVQEDQASLLDDDGPDLASDHAKDLADDRAADPALDKAMADAGTAPAGDPDGDGWDGEEE